MLMRFSFFVLFMIFVICQTASLYRSEDENDDDSQLNNLFRSLTPEQLAELDEYLSDRLEEESLATSSGEVLDRNTRRPDESSMVKRDLLWKTTEVLECVRRLKYSKDLSKLDFGTEMLNCITRLRRAG